MNKVAFVTGATRGIGKQIAITLAKEGYDIAVNYRSENEDLTAVINEIESAREGIKCFTVKADISNFEECESAVKAIIDNLGKIDVLVNNAGITKDTLLLRMKKEDFDSVVDVNLGGTFNVTKNVASYMLKAKSGRIINVSSVVGISGNAGQCNYAASKAGVIGFTKSLAKELDMLNENSSLLTLTYHGSTKVIEGYNVMGVAKAALEANVRYLAENLGKEGMRVNAVSAGPIKTLSAKGIKDFSSVLTVVEEKSPLHRNVTIEQVGNVSAFLLSNISDSITGQIIYADSGYNIMGI